jgi:glutamate-1-semialdehyde 2,1-aminomutase
MSTVEISSDSSATRKFDRSNELRKKAHALIPGGAHTYAKGDDQYPQLSPGFFTHGKGCHVWDVDGNEYIEYGMGLRSVTLGHAYDRVNDAAYRAMQLGLNFTRPSALEVECAEMFLSMIQGAEMVKFAKNGSDVTTAAVKLARAFTGRDLIAICADHPFFSTDDWFIGTTGMPAGIPQAIKDLTVKFNYNDPGSIQQLFDQYPNQVACLIMECETTHSPENNFLQEAKRLCHENGAVFIIDEIITGFRWHNHGAQFIHNITPDLCTFGKALGNGFAISALTGRKDIMERGGLMHDKERVFLLSTTFGAESHCLGAAMEVMKIYQQEPVVEHLWRQGKRLIEGVDQIARAAGISDYFGTDGKPCNLVYVTKDPQGNRSQPFRALFMQEIIKRGVIGPSFVVSYSHTDADIDRTLDVVAEALVVYKQALENGYEKYLVGSPVAPVSRSYVAPWRPA